MDFGTVIIIIVLIFIGGLLIWCINKGYIGLVMIGYPTDGNNNGQGNNGQGNNGGGNNGGQGNNNGGASNNTNSNSTANANANNANTNANINTPTPFTLNNQPGQPSPPPHENTAGDQGQGNQGQGKYDLQLSEGGDSLFKSGNSEIDGLGTLIKYMPDDKSQANSQANSQPNLTAKEIVNSGYQWTDTSNPQYPEPSRAVTTANAYGGSQVITGGQSVIPEATRAMGFSGEIPTPLQYKTV